jgi:branched-chain amino acid transport system substrate-binding protein
MMKRNVKRLVLGTLIASLLPMAATASDKEPIKIAAVTSLTGVFAQQGEEALRGIQFAVDEANANGGIDGREVIIKTADDESTPEGARRVTERLTREGHKFVIGPISSSISLTLAQSMKRWDAVYFGILSKMDGLTGSHCNARLFRTNHSDRMDMAMMREWMKGVEGSTFAVIAADYNWGHDSATFFDVLTAEQGKENKLSLFAPLGTTDFAPYITQLKAAGVDSIWVAMVGRDAIAFVRQAESFGLTAQSKLIGHSLIFNYLVEATEGATEGVWGNIGYGAEIDTEMNRTFVAAWQQRFGRFPTENEGQAYNGTRTIFEGVRLAGSVQPAAVASALEGAHFDTIHGPALMRAEDHQLLIPNYMGKVSLADGKLRPVIEKTFGTDLYATPSAECRL